MIWFLLFILLTLLILSYQLTGKDFFSPACMMIIAFIVSTISSIINLNRWKYELGLETIIILIAGMLIILIINSVIHNYYKKKRVRVFDTDSEKLPMAAIIVFLLIVTANVFLQLQYVRRVVGSNSITGLMYAYRMKTSYGTGDYSMPGYLNQLNHLSLGICYICALNIVINLKKLKKKEFVMSIATILLWVVKILLNASRFDVFSLLISIVFMYYMNRMRIKGGYRKFKIKSIIKLLTILLISIFFFYNIADLIGRKSDASFMEYITSYSGTQIPNFDLFLKDSSIRQNAFPGETFYSLLQWLRRRGISSIPIISIHKEFRTTNGYSLGNTYTAFRDYYHDFGFLGTILLHTLFSTIVSLAYERGKKKITNWGILFQSVLYGCIPMYMFNNTFFGTYLSPTFLISILEMFMLYKVFMDSKGLFIRRSKKRKGTVLWQK